MKKIAMKVMALLCVVFMLIGCVGVYAAKGESSEKLYEKYKFDENFEYDATMIGFAMRTSVPLIQTLWYATVEYQPVVFDKEYFLQVFESLLEENGCETEEEARELANLLIEDLRVNTADYLFYGNAKKVDVVTGGTGSGVVISEDGYIATNSHVVTFGEDERKMYYLMKLEADIAADVEKVVTDIGEYGVVFSEEEGSELYNLILEASVGRMMVLEEEVHWEVYFPTADGRTGIEDTIFYEADVVADGTKYDIEGYTQDAAILKIDADNLVAFKLSDSYPNLNDAIVSAGFPGAADQLFVDGGSSASTLSIYSSTGSVSRLVPFEGADYQAIGINTDISYGSSGGPSVDMKLDVEGLNTNVNPDDLRFAYMVPAAYVKDLANGIELSQGDVTKTFLTGLQLLQNGYGPAALECFEYVESKQPELAYIQDMIKKAKDAPQNEFPTDNGLDSNMILIICCAAAGVIVIVLIIVLIKKKNKKVVTNVVPTAVAPGENPASVMQEGMVTRQAQQVQPPLNRTQPVQPVNPRSDYRTYAPPATPTAAPTVAPTAAPTAAPRPMTGVRPAEAPSTHSAFERASDLD